MAKVKVEKFCDGMRDDGTCGNGYNAENHNKPCAGKKCKERFHYGQGNVVVTPRSVPANGYRERVSEQYRITVSKTEEFFREAIKFGALLNEVEQFIGEGRGRGKEGSGLKGWLEENCPEVRYATAMRWKDFASRFATMIGGGYQAIACLQGKDTIIPPGEEEAIDVESKFVEKRDAVFDKANNFHKLEQMLMAFMEKEKPGPGRPVGSGGTYKPKSAIERAAAAVFPVVNQMLNHRKPMFEAYEILPINKLTELKETIEEHLTAIEDALKKRK